MSGTPDRGTDFEALLANTDGVQESGFSQYSRDNDPARDTLRQLRQCLVDDEDRETVLECTARMGKVGMGTDLTAVHNFLQALISAVLYTLRQVNLKDREKIEAIDANLNSSRVEQHTQAVTFRFANYLQIADFDVYLPLLPDGFLLGTINGTTPPSLGCDRHDDCM